MPREVQWFINHHKDEGVRAAQLKDDGDETRRQLIRLYALYQETCDKGGLVDFAELLLRAFELWKKNPELLGQYRRRFRHVIVHAEGPERIAPEWWRAKEGAPTRDYYRIEDRQGRRFWLFRAGDYNAARPCWYVHGVFA